MYKKKPVLRCHFPFSKKFLRVLVLNGSLKHKGEMSNTEELARHVIHCMRELGFQIKEEIVRLADKHIPVGLRFKESRDDDWPKLAQKIKDADIILFCTPIWWGNHSSLMQRVIERFDAFDEQYHTEGQNVLYNKVAGIVITGSEDGAQHTMGCLMEVLSWMGFTLPPECCAYWIGEVGVDHSQDAQRRRKNAGTKYMAKNLARNLVYYAHLLHTYPLEFDEE